jgi:RimJ/RimL family protein N-acetyltransferase
LCGLVKRSSLPEPDIGFALLPEYRRSGYALEAARAVLGHARSIGLSRLLGIVIPENTASVRLLERLGFSCEGTYRPPHEDKTLKLYAQSLV